MGEDMDRWQEGLVANMRESSLDFLRFGRLGREAL